jgi:hypothetical protein
MWLFFTALLPKRKNYYGVGYDVGFVVIWQNGSVIAHYDTPPHIAQYLLNTFKKLSPPAYNNQLPEAKQKIALQASPPPAFLVGTYKQFFYTRRRAGSRRIYRENTRRRHGRLPLYTLTF